MRFEREIHHEATTFLAATSEELAKGFGVIVELPLQYRTT